MISPYAEQGSGFWLPSVYEAVGFRNWFAVQKIPRGTPEYGHVTGVHSCNPHCGFSESRDIGQIVASAVPGCQGAAALTERRSRGRMAPHHAQRAGDDARIAGHAIGVAEPIALATAALPQVEPSTIVCCASRRLVLGSHCCGPTRYSWPDTSRYPSGQPGPSLSQTRRRCEPIDVCANTPGHDPPGCRRKRGSVALLLLHTWFACKARTHAPLEREVRENETTPNTMIAAAPPPRSSAAHLDSNRQCSNTKKMHNHRPNNNFPTSPALRASFYVECPPGLFLTFPISYLKS